MTQLVQFACLSMQFQPLAQIDKPLTQLSTPQHKTKTVGGLDMGGASTEITFIPENTTAIERGYNQSVQLYGTMYEMYTFSYECYGLNEAYRRYLAHLVQVNDGVINFDLFIVLFRSLILSASLYFSKRGAY